MIELDGQDNAHNQGEVYKEVAEKLLPESNGATAVLLRSLTGNSEPQSEAADALPFFKKHMHKEIERKKHHASVIEDFMKRRRSVPERNLHLVVGFGHTLRKLLRTNLGLSKLGFDF